MPDGLLVSLIDLSAQADDTWDAPKSLAAPLDGVRVSILRRGEDAPRFAIASPDAPQLAALDAGAKRALRHRHLARVRHVGARLDPGRGGMSRQPARRPRTSVSLTGGSDLGGCLRPLIRG